MEDANYEAAIGRLTGNFQVDANELSRYSYKIEVPSGIGYGNEPEISLEYSQGSSNGILGQGWSLAGLSSILKCPASLPFDGVNNPQGYDRSKLRLSLDGNELLNVKGEYFAVDAVYKHEISEPGRSVTCLGDGFVARDAAGIKIEYGTSEDSRSVSSDNHTTKEWHIKRQIDIHGNYVSYNYVTSLSTGAKESSETADVNVRYIDSIVYTSNEITGYQGKRFVKFEYATRTDPVTQIFLGEKRTYAHLLSAIHIGVKLEDVDYIIRSYKLNYVISGVTGSTCLSKITECSSLDKNKQSSLMPTVFNYTGKVLQPNELFTTGSEGTTSLFQTRNNVALMPMNISGRSMTDLACIRYDKDSQNMSVKTFLAFQQAEKHEGVCTIKWKASQGSGSEASLPSIEIGEDKPTPNFLSADLNGDGRMDLIIPFRGSDGNLSFSISQSTGTGFLDYTVKPTNITWSDESKFLATDLEGRGRTDIIQIFSQNKYLAFRIFRALNERGKGALADGKLTRVDYDFTTTLSWLELDMYRDGSKCIVRIWAEEQQRGDSMLKATTFALRHVSGSNDTKFEETSTSNIGKYSRDDQKKVSVLTCDINGDGVQDIVTCLVNIESEGPDNFMTFTFTTFLNDGFGGFLLHGTAIQRRFEIPSKGLPLNDGSFHVTSLYGSEYPCLAYVYQETKSRDFVALVAQGSCTGFVGELKYCKLAGHDDLPPLGDIQVTSADLNGTGLGGWLMYSLTNDTFDITSVYNRGSMADLLSSARDPIGKLTKVSYLPMSNSEVYKPSVAWDEYPPVAGAVDYPILAAPTYVVSEVKVTNDPTVNNLPFSSGYIKTYYGAKVNSKGRGWQSFSHMDTYDTSSNITTSEEFHQEWPFTGLKRKEETRSGRRKNGILVHSEESKYNRVFTEEAVWKIFHLNKKSERRNIIESDVTVRSTEVSYEYDNNGNMILECSNSDSGSQLWTRYLYTSINGMTGLPTAKKVSSRDSNRDMEVFEEGDLGLTHVEYNPQTGTLKTLKEWSTDTASFAMKSSEFDQYGNEIVSTDTFCGLKTVTHYEETFHSYPVRVVEQGNIVDLYRSSAFHPLTGKEIARQDVNGSITCYVYDDFGRCTSSKKVAVPGSQSEGLVTVQDFWGNSHILIHPTFEKILNDAKLSPHRDLAFTCHNTATDFNYIYSTATLLFKPGEDGRTTVKEYIDCVGRVRKRITKHGQTDEIYRFYDYDSRGNKTLESYPNHRPNSVPPEKELEWQPDRSSYILSTFDTLQRPLDQVSPSRNSQYDSIITRNVYKNGGALVETLKIKSHENEKGIATEAVISKTQKRFAFIAGHDTLTATTDENGNETTFSYDSLARMILCTDPGNKKESRSYNTSGRVTRVIDDYRGEVNRKYDLANNLVEETNAVGETMHYQYDAKGRVLQAEGHNGETIIYEYDNSGTDNLLSVTKKQSPDDKCYESKRTFEYDILGRPTAVTLYLSDDESYRTSLAYDWQDQLVQKTLPDTTVISQEFSGALLLSTNMKGIFGKVSTSYTDYNAFEKPEEWKLNGQGSIKADFSYKADYDMKGFPSSYALSTAPSLLVQNNYTYNDNDQLSLVLEQVSKDRSEYTYAAGRLFSSQHGGGDTNKYSYDLSGNLVEKGGLTFTYDSKKVTGNKGDKNVIAVTYDDVGRMVQRSANGTDYAYKYNDFGNIKIITNQKTQAIAKISSDHQGHTLVRSLPDGTREILISKDFEILIGRDKSRRIRRRIYSPDRLLATIRTDYLPKTSSSPQTEMHSMEVFFTDTKGNVTHAFEQDGKLRRRSKYDDFGLSTTSDDGDDSTTYEGRSYDGLTGLLDFGSRWYDPLLGRFTVPDNILDETALKRQDGINRYAFENNDPINHIDPTGNISKNAVWGILASVALIGASLLLSAATAGAFSGVAAILIGGVIGGLMGAGLAGLSYSWSHRDEQSSDKFWGGWLVSAGIGFGTGFVTGALGAWISNLVSVGRLVEAAKSVVTLIRVNQTAQNINRVATIMSIGGRALASSFASVVSKVSSNYIDQKYYGKNSDLWDGWYTAAAMGFVSGAALAGASDYYDAAGKERLNAAWDLVKKSREYKCENVFNEPGVWESFFRNSNASQSIPLIPGQAVSDGVKFGSGLIPHKNPFM